MTPTILVTGGTGFIGSHTTVLLQEAGFQVLILDNLSNSEAQVATAIENITGQAPTLIQGDIRDEALLKNIFTENNIQAVVHFAGLKAVGESVAQPLLYYDNNIHGTNTLLRTMAKAQVKTILFSSSATVYGEPQALPLTESHPLSSTNPYGHSKLVIEQMLGYLYQSDPQWRICNLRYFNPVGAHPSGHIGESPRGIPNNLMPYIVQVAAGQRSQLQVFGDDYPTPDGTGVRDYIHVMDLAAGHLAALQRLLRPESETQGELLNINLGTGRGYSVLEMIAAMEKVTGRPIPYEISPRRPGDIASCWASTEYATQALDWRAQLGLEQMCADAWRHAQMHLGTDTERK